jgi:hypothetical protein
MHRKIGRGFLARKTFLLMKQSRKHVLNEIVLAAFLSFREGIQGNEMPRCEKHRNHDFLIEITGLSLGIVSSCRRANIESDSIR